MPAQLTKKFFSEYREALDARKEVASANQNDVEYAYFAGAAHAIENIIRMMNEQESGELQ